MKHDIYKVFDALNSENIDEEDVIILYNADRGWFHCIIEDLEGSLSKQARELVKRYTVVLNVR